MDVKRWLELQAEIDARMHLLEGMHQKQRARSPLDQMIDEATGHEAATTEGQLELLRELIPLWEEHAEVTGQDNSAFMEGAKQILQAAEAAEGDE
jgi:hypothetical protein